jgi:membrane protein YdbS with pleckstrin-like domain
LFTINYMSEKVAQYIIGASAKGLDRGQITEKLKKIGLSDEEISAAYSQTDAPAGGDKRAQVAQWIDVAGRHAGDMFKDSARKNHMPFAPSATIYVAGLNVLGVAVLGVIILAAILVAHLPILVMSAPLILALVAAWYGKAYVDSYIFALDGGCFYLRKGVFIRAHTLLPYGNIQDIHVVQGIIERLLGLSTVVIFTATTSGAGSEAVFGLSREGADRLKADLFAKVKGVKHVSD